MILIQVILQDQGDAEDKCRRGYLHQCHNKYASQCLLNESNYIKIFYCFCNFGIIRTILSYWQQSELKISETASHSETKYHLNTDPYPRMCSHFVVDPEYNSGSRTKFLNISKTNHEIFSNCCNMSKCRFGHILHFTFLHLRALTCWWWRYNTINENFTLFDIYIYIYMSIPCTPYWKSFAPEYRATQSAIFHVLVDKVYIMPAALNCIMPRVKCFCLSYIRRFLTLTVLVTTIDALQHFETG